MWGVSQGHELTEGLGQWRVRRLEVLLKPCSAPSGDDDGGDGGDDGGDDEFQRISARSGDDDDDDNFQPISARSGDDDDVDDGDPIQTSRGEGYVGMSDKGGVCLDV
jgi:hypothetical protein